MRTVPITTFTSDILTALSGSTGMLNKYSKEDVIPITQQVQIKLNSYLGDWILDNFWHTQLYPARQFLVLPDIVDTHNIQLSAEAATLFRPLREDLYTLIPANNDIWRYWLELSPLLLAWKTFPPKIVATNYLTALRYDAERRGTQANHTWEVQFWRSLLPEPDLVLSEALRHYSKTHPANTTFPTAAQKVFRTLFPTGHRFSVEQQAQILQFLLTHGLSYHEVMSFVAPTIGTG